MRRVAFFWESVEKHWFVGGGVLSATEAKPSRLPTATTMTTVLSTIECPLCAGQTVQGTVLCCASALSHVRLFVTPWTVAHQAPLSLGILQQEYWSGLPCPPPGDLPTPGTEPRSPTLQVDSLPSEPPEKPVQGTTHPLVPLSPHTKALYFHFTDEGTKAQRN